MKRNSCKQNLYSILTFFMVETIRTSIWTLCVQTMCTDLTAYKLHNYATDVYTLYRLDSIQTTDKTTEYKLKTRHCTYHGPPYTGVKLQTRRQNTNLK